MSGRVVQATLLQRHDGQSRGRAVVEYAHPLEALQARVMFRQAKLHTRPMIITQDKLGPPPTIPGRNPEGLVDVMGGIGTNGARLKVEFL